MKLKKSIFILACTVFTLCLLYVLHDTAEASRMGGGKSFGSRPSYQRSAPSPSPSPSPTSPQLSPGQTARPGALPGATSPMGRWGGMLGGLLMGGLIGSLLFGGGHGWGGPGIFDLLLLGGGLFLLFRFLRARRMATAGASSAGSMSFDRGPAQEWGASGYHPAGDASAAAEQAPVYPAGFDADDFLKGAKVIYTRLQSSWDKRDLEDIRQFTKAEVFDEIRRQALADPHPGKTELLLINPRIIEVREIEGQFVVSVLYDVMMRETNEELSKQVRELWHFSRDANKPHAFWVLEGIQQIEG
jgi:predicted lipid-binding transport protein (Tim44 family)